MITSGVIIPQDNTVRTASVTPSPSADLAGHRIDRGIGDDIGGNAYRFSAKEIDDNGASNVQGRSAVRRFAQNQHESDKGQHIPQIVPMKIHRQNYYTIVAIAG